MQLKVWQVLALKLFAFSPSGSLVMKRPAADTMKRPSAADTKRTKHEAKEEEVEEQREEEEEEESLPLTESALKDHTKFMEEVGKLDEKPFSLAFSKLPEKQQQCLWKKFEWSRRAVDLDNAYKRETQGSGSMVRKRNLLRSWALDGGKCDKIFRKAMQSIALEKKHGVEKEWYSKKKMEDELGVEEMTARLKAGTLKWRRNPEDTRFFQFQKLAEKEATMLTKVKGGSREVKGTASKDELLAFDHLMLEDLNEDDFVLGLGDGEEEEEFEGINKDLAKAMGLKNNKDPKSPKKDKENKWAALSQVDESDGKKQINQRVMKFKTELTKDLASLEAGVFSLREQKGDKALVKAVLVTQEQAKKALKVVTNLLASKSGKSSVASGLSEALAELQLAKALKA